MTDYTTPDAIALVTATLDGDAETAARIGLDYSDRPATLAGVVATVLIFATAAAGLDENELRDALQVVALSDARNGCRRRGTWTGFWKGPREETAT